MPCWQLKEGDIVPIESLVQFIDSSECATRGNRISIKMDDGSYYEFDFEKLVKAIMAVNITPRDARDFIGF